MFQVGQHEDFAGLRSEYLGHQSQQFDRGRARRLGRGGDGETERLMGVGIEGEKCRGHFEWLGLLLVAVAAHLPFAVTVGAVRVDRQQFSRVIARGPANSPQGDLQPLGFRDDVLGQQAVHRHVAGHEGQPVGQLESALTENPLLTHAAGA